MVLALAILLIGIGVPFLASGGGARWIGLLLTACGCLLAYRSYKSDLKKNIHDKDKR